MTPKEIVEIDLQKTGVDIPLNRVMAGLNQMTERGAKLLQEGNTLFVLTIRDKETAEFHLFNADTPQQLVINVEKFARLVKQLGFKRMITDFDNPKLANLFQRYQGEFKTKVTQSGDKYIAEVTL
jgi:hypothetical protein